MISINLAKPSQTHQKHRQIHLTTYKKKEVYRNKKAKLKKIEEIKNEKENIQELYNFNCVKTI